MPKHLSSFCQTTGTQAGQGSEGGQGDRAGVLLPGRTSLRFRGSGFRVWELRFSSRV